MFEKSSNVVQGPGALNSIVFKLDQLNSELADVILALDNISYRVFGPSGSGIGPAIEKTSEKICAITTIHEKLEAYSDMLARLRNVTQSLDGL